MGDYRKFDFDLVGSEAMSWSLTEVEDNTAVIKDNQQRKESGNNGWTPGKRQRRLARIPLLVVATAEKMGYDMKGNGVYKFLADFPQYLSVPNVLSPRNGSAVSQGRVIIN